MTVRARILQGALGLMVCFAPFHGAHGEGSGRHESVGVANAPANQLSIQVNNDRLTLAMAKVTQVYLFGAIDTGAPARFEQLTRSRKIPPGADIYLNSPGGDPRAAMALGRMFRAGSMVTHLGASKRGAHASLGSISQGLISQGAKTSTCVNACVYAYLGGLYRWAPSGNDRIGLQVSNVVGSQAGAAGNPSTSSELAAYLKDMGINADAFASLATSGGITWLTTNQLGVLGMANNGYLPLTASYRSASGVPMLVLDQKVRDGEHKVELLCRPEGPTLTAYNVVGAEHAGAMAARGTQAYFEIDHRELLPQQRRRASVIGSAVVSSAPFSLEQLQRLATAQSFGAWLGDRNGAVRYGFTIAPYWVRGSLESYYAQCRQVMQRTSAPSR